jgi:hypothetical protein
MPDDTALIVKPCVETARAKHSTLSKPRNYSGFVHERHNCRHFSAHRQRGVNLGEGTARQWRNHCGRNRQDQLRTRPTLRIAVHRD